MWQGSVKFYQSTLCYVKSGGVVISVSEIEKTLPDFFLTSISACNALIARLHFAYSSSVVPSLIIFV